LYCKGDDFSSFVVADENIITGQNRASAIDAAKQLLLLARKRKAIQLAIA
jgi:putative intracellular protease/amidase